MFYFEIFFSQHIIYIDSCCSSSSTEVTGAVVVKVAVVAKVAEIPFLDLTKEWAKKHLPALMRTNPDKESSTLKTLKNKEPSVKFWFY